MAWAVDYMFVNAIGVAFAAQKAEMRTKSRKSRIVLPILMSLLGSKWHFAVDPAVRRRKPDFR